MAQLAGQIRHAENGRCDRLHVDGVADRHTGAESTQHLRSAAGVQPGPSRTGARRGRRAIPIGRASGHGVLMRSQEPSSAQKPSPDRQTIRLERMLDTAVDGMVVIDRQGVMQAFNPASARIFGYTAEEVVGRNVSMLMPEPYRSGHNGYLDNYHRTADAKIIGIGREVVGRRKNGDEFPMDLAVSAFDSENGWAYIGTIRDISERKALEKDLQERNVELRVARDAAEQRQRKAEDEANRLESIMNTTVDGLIVYDEAGIVRLVNAACEQMFGYAANDIVGQSVSRLMPDPHGFGEDQRPEAIEATELHMPVGTRREIVGRHRDGREFPMDLSVGTFDADGKRAYVGIVRDVTSRVEMLARLERQNEDLRRSNRDLEQFAYIASHDLKSPLRGVSTAAAWLTEDLQGELTEEHRHLLDLMQQRIGRMEMLLDGVLLYSRAHRDESALEAVDVATVIDGIRESGMIPDGFDLVVAGDLPMLQGRPIAVQQIFQNLIGNAIKHHDRDAGHIQVSATDEGPFYRFSVTDDGPGIPPRFRGRVFKMFEKLAPKDEVEGSGIGLALVRKLIERAGGRIHIHDNENKRGCTVGFDWPKEPRQQDTEAETGR